MAGDAHDGGLCRHLYHQRETARMGLLTLAVDPRIEVGEQLAVRTENSINGTTFSFLCSGSVAYRSMSPLTPSALPGVFETGIEGVG
ncbi:hypothetical protein IC615_21915 [Serratia ureilytica]